MAALRLILFLVLPGLAAAESRADLFGTWGDARQCARALLQPGGTLRAAPFVIGEDWMQHGQSWCRLAWFPAQPRVGGVFVSSRALCGEDSARAYRLDFSLRDSGLSLIWEETLVNGPLLRCPATQ